MYSKTRILAGWLICLGLAGCLTWDPDERELEWHWPNIRTPGKPVWELVIERLPERDPEAVRRFWTEAWESLHGDDIERLAEAHDYVQTIMERYGWLPGIENYAEWLEGRRLYFEAAEEALAEERRQREAQQAAARAADARRRAAASVRPALRPSRYPPAQVMPPALPPLPRLPTAFSKTPLPPSPPLKKPTGKTEAVKRDTVQTGRAYWRKKLGNTAQPSRADAMVPLLEKVFRAEGVPVELIWIAEVESTMNPRAKSPAGAVGLFQLMPRTATSLGLSLKPEDERLDPEKNARASALYLSRLHRRFDCWSLTLAAYNAGQGRVASLQRRHGASFDAIVSHLPLETRLYVPRVFETVRVRTGVDPETLPPPGRV